jgi:CBS domain-containing protein
VDQHPDWLEPLAHSDACSQPPLDGEVVDPPAVNSRARFTYLDGERWESEVSFYCPVRDRALTRDECRACRECRAGEQPGVTGCAHPAAQRFAGEELLRAPRPPSLADRTPLWQVMRPSVVCVRTSLVLDELMTLFVSYDMRAVPVVDGDGRPVGVVSRSDLVEHLVDARGELGPGSPASLATVGDVMMCVAFTLCEDASLSHAAALMAYEGVHRIPVVSFDGKVVGIVTSMDVVRWLAQHDGYVVPDSRTKDA